LNFHLALILSGQLLISIFVYIWSGLMCHPVSVTLKMFKPLSWSFPYFAWYLEKSLWSPRVQLSNENYLVVSSKFQKVVKFNHFNIQKKNIGDVIDLKFFWVNLSPKPLKSLEIPPKYPKYLPPNSSSAPQGIILPKICVYDQWNCHSTTGCYIAQNLGQ